MTAATLSPIQITTTFEEPTKGIKLPIRTLMGVPGGPPDQKGIVLSKRPLAAAGVKDGVMYSQRVGSKRYLRSFQTVRYFEASPRSADGVEIGEIAHYTDTGIGQPFIERTESQVSPDDVERIRAYLYDEPVLAMYERRRLAKESARYVTEKGAPGGVRPDTKRPEDALKDVADDRVKKMVEEMVAKGVADALAAEKAKK